MRGGFCVMALLNNRLLNNARSLLNIGEFDKLKT